MIARSTPVVSDEELLRLSRANPGYKIERTDDGGLEMSPTSSGTAAKEAEAIAQLVAYAKRVGGKAFGSQAGFTMPGGGVRCPDASWLSAKRYASLDRDVAFWHVAPDVCVEIASATDRWSTLCEKIDRFVRDGAAFAIALDPATRTIHTCGIAPPDLRLDVAAILDA